MARERPAKTDFDGEYRGGRAIFRSRRKLILFRVMHNGVFVLVVDLDTEKLFHTFGRPHLHSIPCHTLTDVDADFASDALVKADLNIGDDDVHTVRRIARRMFDTVDRTKTHARFATGA